MNLLQILYPGIGGHSSVAFSLIEGDSCHEVSHCLMGYGIENPSGSFLLKSKELNVPFTTIKKEEGFDFKSLKQVYRELKRIKPDAIIMHSTAVIVIVWWYCIWHKTKFLSVEHQSNNAKTKKDWVYSLLILLLSPKVVYLTTNYAEEIKVKFKILYPTRKVKVINNGINTYKFKPNAKIRNGEEYTFSMISRMTVLRDHKTLIDAFCEIAEDKNYRLLMAGDGTTKRELEKYVLDKKIGPKIVFTGSIDEETIIELIQQTDIYIHSSLAETLSTSILQVMACKVPIIATDIPGINNVLFKNQDALLFTPKDRNALISQIKKLINDKELAKQLYNNSYEKVLRNYSCIEMFEKYKTLFN
ncbi:MAG: glycosyltransferase family 4 protein [bacterium]|nr:glycosyltransferase family 4 protein [bacterium]